MDTAYVLTDDGPKLPWELDEMPATTAMAGTSTMESKGDTDFWLLVKERKLKHIFLLNNFLLVS